MTQKKLANIPLVDTHAHVFTKGVLPVSPDAHPFLRDYTYQDYIKELDYVGIRYGVIAAASFMGPYSDYTLSALEASDRLRATIILDPGSGFTDLKPFNAAGVVGVRLALGNMRKLPDFTSSAYRSVWAQILKYGWHVHIYGSRNQLLDVLPVLHQAGVPIVVDHFGIRDNDRTTDQALFSLVYKIMKSNRLWLKLSAPYWSTNFDHKKIVSRVLDDGFSHRLLWGSDWPFLKKEGQISYQQILAWYLNLISDVNLGNIIDRNALDLYRFPAFDLKR